MDKFWKRSEPDSNGCWIWQGATLPSGYGVLQIDNKMKRAHRVAFALATGREPSNHVLHRCDVTNCVNPDHLYDGTHADNMRDMMKRGRFSNGKTRVTAEMVREVRRVCPGERQVDVAARLGISQGCVSQIVRRETWRHVLA